MSGNDINRRKFLKLMGWGGAGAAVAGCDMPTTVTLEEGKETVVSYLVPEEYVIPGVGVWYASTCQQCAAGCGIHGRVREGRVLKLEGNPESDVNKGKLCNMGQAGLQNHYNPDRVRAPLMRKGGTLTQVTWDEALAVLDEKVGAKSSIPGSRIAWFTGAMSGHQLVLLNAHLSSLSSSNHFVHEVINNAVARAANKDVLGVEQPVYHVNKAKAIFSLGADLVGASTSPVHFATQYAEFRSAPRGVLIQAEPSMSLTGANADLWLPVRPGTEIALLLGVANVLIAQHGVASDSLSSEARAAIGQYTADKAAADTGVSKDRIEHIAKTLKERAPSLVLTGASAESQTHGYQVAAAAAMLNVLLGNVGTTITAHGEFPFPDLAPKSGNTRDLLAFADAADKGAFDVAFICSTNPSYTAPAALKFNEKLAKVPFKVVLTQFNDETAKNADLVLPLASALEDWGTHVSGYQPETQAVAMQQPLMEKLYTDTKGMGDILLALLKQRRANDYGQFNDYYSYVRAAVTALPGDFKGGKSDEHFWSQTLQKGLIPVPSTVKALSPKAVAISAGIEDRDANAPLHLVPAARLGMWDGRHANSPWLQEQPDQISKAVWGSWAEIHPRTADKLGVKTGDTITVTSAAGSADLPVYVYRGVHPDVVAVPMGQGHEEYGRYAKGRGVNPLKLLDVTKESKTGELALYGTRVKVAKAATAGDTLVRFGGSETQVGRKLVATIKATVFNRTESKGA